MKKTLVIFLSTILIFGCSNRKDQEENTQTANNTQSKAPMSKAEKIITEMVDEIGGQNALKDLFDVEYTYIYESPEGHRDVSKERYIFDGELSWAEYLERSDKMMPNYQGTIIQSYNGDSTVTTVDGKQVDTPEINKRSDFLRKTNFYWFVMNFKLLDPGVNLKYNGVRLYNGINYEMVEVNFDEQTGDVQDKYLLYINPNTKLIDQFLFTVKDYGLEQPFMMRVKYEEIEGVKLTTYREYALSNWDGDIVQDQWTKEWSEDISFNNGFTVDDFRLK